MWNLFKLDGRSGRGAHLMCYLDICLQYGLPVNRFTWILYRWANRVPA